tara:strand:+ start:8942 stop:9649 length:708 start_codon:yes stop_codon:yes gene_type:complete
MSSDNAPFLAKAPPGLAKRKSEPSPQYIEITPAAAGFEKLAKQIAQDRFDGPTEYESELHKELAELKLIVNLLQVASPAFSDVRKSIAARADAYYRKMQHDALLAGPSAARTKACLDMPEGELKQFAPKLTTTHIRKLSVPARKRALACLPPRDAAAHIFQLLPADSRHVDIVSITDLSEEGQPKARYVVAATAPEGTETMIVTPVPEKVARSYALRIWQTKDRDTGGKVPLPSL